MKAKVKGDKKFLKKVQAARKAKNAAKKKLFLHAIDVVGEWARRRMQERNGALYYLRHLGFSFDYIEVHGVRV